MKQLKIATQKQHLKFCDTKHRIYSASSMKRMSVTFICCLFVCAIVFSITAPLQMKKTNNTTANNSTKVKETQKPQILETFKSKLKATVEPTQKPIIIATEKEELYTETNLNLRESPTTKSKVIMVVPNSEKLTAYATSVNSWYYTTYKKKSGYVSKRYLSKTKTTKYINIGLEYEYQDLVRELIKIFKFDVDEYFFYGMMYTENRFRQEPESAAGAQGILQILPSTWNSLLPLIKKEHPDLYRTLSHNPSDKRSNIVVGMYYIKYIRDSYNCTSVADNASKILTTYNRGGKGAKNFYKKNGTYSTSYSREILRAAKYIRAHKTWKEGL